jgi:hypothetical protein
MPESRYVSAPYAALSTAAVLKPWRSIRCSMGAPGVNAPECVPYHLPLYEKDKIMTLPGFTAEAAIYKSKGRYTAKAAVDLGGSSAIRPAYTGYGFDPSIFLPRLDWYLDFANPGGWAGGNWPCADFCREDCVTKGYVRHSAEWHRCVADCMDRVCSK